MLARAPREGRVKTRLASRLGAQWALDLHEAFLRDTLGWLQPLAREGWIARVEWSEPFRPRGELRRALCGFDCGVQTAGGLGRRIDSALRTILARGADCALAIGSDSPHLGAAPLRQARAVLRRCDVVLGPARDGGYYLIGVRTVRRRWFQGIDWGTARVLRQTMSRLRADALKVHRLASAQDLDTSANLWHLQRRLGRSAVLRRRLKFSWKVLREMDETTPLNRGRSSNARR